MNKTHEFIDAYFFQKSFEYILDKSTTNNIELLIKIGLLYLENGNILQKVVRRLSNLTLNPIQQKLDNRFIRKMTTQQIRIMTFNIHGWMTSDFYDSYQLIVDVVKQTQPHVLLLQEVTHPFYTQPDKYRQTFLEGGNMTGKSLVKKVGNSHLEKLSKQFGFNYVFAEAISDGYMGKVPFGNAILSQFPLDNIKKKVVHLTTNKKRRICLEDRVGIVATIPDLNWKIATLHLDQLNEDVRLKQIKEIMSEFSNINIIGGDLNCFFCGEFSQILQEKVKRAWEKNEWEAPTLVPPTTIRFLKENYKDVVPKNLGPTCWSSNPLIRTDYIWVDKHFINEVTSEIYHTQASDHYPVMMTIKPKLFDIH